MVRADVEYGLAQTPSGPKLVLLAPLHASVLECTFQGECSEFEGKDLAGRFDSAQKMLRLYAPD